jgi:hypothetical protein
MTDHLPECRKRFSEGRLGEFVQCICTYLRDCEQRVAAMRKDSGELWLDGYGTGFQDGHSDGLDAALKAVESVSHWTDSDIALALPWSVRGEKWIAKDLALAAIDALREKQK